MSPSAFPRGAPGRPRDGAVLLLPDAPDVGEHADDGGRGGERPNAGGAARQHHIVASASLV